MTSDGMVRQAARVAWDAVRGATGIPTEEALARYELVRLGLPTDHGRLDELARATGSRLTAALAEAARGLTGQDGDALAHAGRALTDLGHRLLAAEAHAAAGRALPAGRITSQGGAVR